MTPELSIVMGVYNGASELPATMDSVLLQQDCDFEFIVIDDGSTDATATLLDDYARHDPRVRVFHQPNAGLTRALIRGCREARAPFIARQDAGDISLPGRFEGQLELLRSNPQAVFVTCGHELVGPAGEPLSVSMPQDSATARERLLSADPDRLTGPHHGTVMFRRQAYESAGGYRAEFRYAQDLDLWTRLIEQGELLAVNQALYRVVFTFSSITARHRERQQQLKGLIAAASAQRRAGGSEAEILRQAASIGPGSKRWPRDFGREAAAAYFVGSCLAERRDPRARRYFLATLRRNPLHLKAWLKLLKA